MITELALGPLTVRGLTLIAFRGERGKDYGDPELEASDDGREFRSVLKVPDYAVTVAFSIGSPLTESVTRPVMCPLPASWKSIPDVVSGAVTCTASAEPKSGWSS